MDKQILLTIFRQVLIFLGSALVSKGVINAEQYDAIFGGANLEVILGAGVTAFAVIWGLLRKKKDIKIINQA